MAGETTGFASIAGLLGPVLAAIAKISGGINRARAFDRQSDILKGQARRELALSRREAMDFRRRQSRLEASARAGRAGSGISGNSGSALLSQAALAGEIELGSLDILNAGQARAAQLRNDARIRRFAGRSALVESAIGAGTTLLTKDNLRSVEGFFTGDEEPIDAGFGPQFTGSGRVGLRSSGSF